MVYVCYHGFVRRFGRRARHEVCGNMDLYLPGMKSSNCSRRADTENLICVHLWLILFSPEMDHDSRSEKTGFLPSPVGG